MKSVAFICIHVHPICCCCIKAILAPIFDLTCYAVALASRLGSLTNCKVNHCLFVTSARFCRQKRPHSMSLPPLCFTVKMVGSSSIF